jgi:hypothetical protein
MNKAEQSQTSGRFSNPKSEVILVGDNYDAAYAATLASRHHLRHVETDSEVESWSDWIQSSNLFLDISGPQAL